MAAVQMSGKATGVVVTGGTWTITPGATSSVPMDYHAEDPGGGTITVNWTDPSLKKIISLVTCGHIYVSDSLTVTVNGSGTAT